MSKKIIIVTFLILAVLGAGGYTYYTLFMKPGTPLTTVNVGTTTNIVSNPFPVSGQASSTATIKKPTSPTGAIDSTPSVVQINVGTQGLVHLTTEPASGFVLVSGISTTSPVVRYTEQKSGHIFDIDFSTFVQNRTSNTTLPNIAEASFTTKGDQGLFRYLKEGTETIESYFFKLSTSTLATGYFLPEDVKTLAISPTGAKILYITSDTIGAQGIVDNRDTKKKSTVFSSAFTDWTVSWPSDTTITLTSRPSSSVSGYLYFLNPSTGSLKPVISGTNGLTTLTNPSATKVLIGDNTNSLFSHDIKTSANVNTGIYSRPEKCVWSNKLKNIAYCGGSTSVSTGSFPDDWYQGTFAFTDSLYKVDANSGTTTKISDISAEYSQNLDMVNLSLSSNEKYLVFKNKTDGTLWSIKLP